MKNVFFGLLLLASQFVFAQDRPFELSVFSAYQTNNRKVEEYYGRPDGIYKEFRITKQVNKHIKLGAFFAHQRHLAFEELILPYQPPAAPTRIEHRIDRYYMPLGLLVELNLTPFFQKQLNIFQGKNNKWGVYTMLQFVYMHGVDQYNRTIPGNYVYRIAYSDPSNRLLFSYPYANYGQKYLGYLFGIKHQTFKRISFSVEAGSGALMQLQAGASFKMN